VSLAEPRPDILMSGRRHEIILRQMSFWLITYENMMSLVMSMSSMLDLGKMLLLLCIAVLLGTQSRAALYHENREI